MRLIRDLSLEAIEREAEHVLQELIPAAAFSRSPSSEVTCEAGAAQLEPFTSD